MKCLLENIDSYLKHVLEKAVAVVNYIKIRPLKLRLLAKLCKEMETNYDSVLLHTYARWLSRGKALSRIYELKKKLLGFFRLEKQKVCDFA